MFGGGKGKVKSLHVFPLPSYSELGPPPLTVTELRVPAQRRGLDISSACVTVGAGTRLVDPHNGNAVARLARVNEVVLLRGGEGSAEGRMHQAREKGTRGSRCWPLSQAFRR